MNKIIDKTFNKLFINKSNHIKFMKQLIIFKNCTRIIMISKYMYNTYNIYLFI